MATAKDRATRRDKARAKPRQLPSAENADSAETQMVQSLARGLDILNAFRRTDRPLGNAELAERTGMTKPTVSRLAYTLTRAGFLQFDPRERAYRPGVKAITLGLVALAMTDVRDVALPLIRRLAQDSQFNVGLGVRDGHHMVYVEACEGDALVGLRLFPGLRTPIVTSAMGRAFLAALPPAERDALLDELRPLHAGGWPAAADGLRVAQGDYERHGYCLSVGDWHKDINGVAVPLQPVPGQPIYVLNLGGPAFALGEGDLRERWGPELVKLARHMEKERGL